MKFKLTLWPLLTPLGWLFAAGSVFRNALWDLGIRKIHRTNARVISVGGLMAGGSGKTPVTIEIVRMLLDELQKHDTGLDSTIKNDQYESPLAIVSRGYGRKTKGIEVVSDGQGFIAEPHQGGDEPVLIARMFPEVPVIAAEDRVAGVRLAEEVFGSQVVVLDDAFSHRRIARDLDILVLSAEIPDWWWRPLPAGRMREWSSSIRRANVILAEDTSLGQRLLEWAYRFHGHDPLLAVVRREIAGIRTLGSKEDEIESIEPPSQISPAVAAAGIARPERFFDALERAGVCLLDRIALPDHAKWNSSQRERVLARCRELNARKLIVTAKDAVKLWGTALDPEVGIYVADESVGMNEYLPSTHETGMLSGTNQLRKMLWKMLETAPPLR